MIGRGSIETALMILLIGIVAATAVAQSGRSWMNGIVFDESDTNGIASATVELVGDPDSPRLRAVKLTTQTDSNGKYSLKDVPYGDYTFRVSAPGFTTYQIKLYIASDALTELHVKLRKQKQEPKKMNRRKFIKTTGASALVTAGTAGSALAGNPAQAKGKKSKRKVSTDRAPKPVGPYSQAIVAGNTIYVAGQGPFDPKTGNMPATFDEQAVQVFENIKAIVEGAGATLADVVKVNVYLADLGNFAKMNEVYKRYFVEDYPARATVGTQLLLGMGIEVECIAVKG